MSVDAEIVVYRLTPPLLREVKVLHRLEVVETPVGGQRVDAEVYRGYHEVVGVLVGEHRRVDLVLDLVAALVRVVDYLDSEALLSESVAPDNRVVEHLAVLLLRKREIRTLVVGLRDYAELVAIVIDLRKRLEVIDLRRFGCRLSARRRGRRVGRPLRAAGNSAHDSEQRGKEK